MRYGIALSVAVGVGVSGVRGGLGDVLPKPLQAVAEKGMGPAATEPVEVVTTEPAASGPAVAGRGAGSGAGVGAGGIAVGKWEGMGPGDVVVIFNTQSANSLRIARYYLSARKVPADHLVPVTVPPGEFVTEEVYRTVLAPQLKKYLTEHRLLGAKCLVTTYDVPLKIGPRVLTAAQKEEMALYRQKLEDATEQLEKDAAAFDGILPAAATEPAATVAASGPAATMGADTGAATNAATSAASRAATGPTTRSANWQQSLRKMLDATMAAAKRIEAAPESQRRQAVSEWTHIQQNAAGLQGVLSAVHISPDAPPTDPARRQYELMAGQFQDAKKQIEQLSHEPDTLANRGTLMGKYFQAYGVAGVVQILDRYLAGISPEESESCLDNELPWVLVDEAYPRAKWIFNPFNVELFVAGRNVPRPLLVTRLDGSTPAKVMEMIDTTIRVEAKGLEGKAYFDARGRHGNDNYALYDADIRNAAEWLKAHSTMDVLLDDREQLLEAKDCPEAAIYCGWYSVSAYHDSGQWVPGAVGYHVASFEMRTLHNPGEPGWVVNLLNRGFCGTLGPTDEPYLNAFPRPQFFFPLLLSGEFTQGEVWQVTAPMLSWRVGFVGDPLYNPFRMRPQVKAEDLKADPILRNAYAILRPAALAPATSTAPASRPSAESQSGGAASRAAGMR